MSSWNLMQHMVLLGHNGGTVDEENRITEKATNIYILKVEVQHDVTKSWWCIWSKTIVEFTDCILQIIVKMLNLDEYTIQYFFHPVSFFVIYINVNKKTKQKNNVTGTCNKLPQPNDWSQHLRNVVWLLWVIMLVVTQKLSHPSWLL